MAVIDIAGFVADLKDHAVEHGFHVHDERHFVESYSLRQTSPVTWYATITLPLRAYRVSGR